MSSSPTTTARPTTPLMTSTPAPFWRAVSMSATPTRMACSIQGRPGYEATQTATAMGPYVNAATVTALSPAGLPVAAQTLSNHLNECPVVSNVQRFGIHQQPTQIVVTFNGPLDPAGPERQQLPRLHAEPGRQIHSPGSGRIRGVQRGEQQRDADARPQLQCPPPRQDQRHEPLPRRPSLHRCLESEVQPGRHCRTPRPRDFSQENECAGSTQPGGLAEGDHTEDRTT